VDEDRRVNSAGTVKPFGKLVARHLERETATIDEQIDELVYELYGLTDDEIKLVEGASGP
jgi:hypothetical protein